MIFSPLRFGPIENALTIQNKTGPGKLYLYSSKDLGAKEFAEVTPERHKTCWVATNPAPVPQALYTGKVKPQETLETGFWIFSLSENTPCLSSGDYQYTEEHDVSVGTIGDWENGTNGPWRTFESDITITKHPDSRFTVTRSPPSFVSK